MLAGVAQVLVLLDVDDFVQGGNERHCALMGATPNEVSVSENGEASMKATGNISGAP